MRNIVIRRWRLHRRDEGCIEGFVMGLLWGLLWGLYAIVLKIFCGIICNPNKNLIYISAKAH
jgi:hypothetical protein